MSLQITPDMLLSSKRECVNEALRLYGKRLMDVFQLSGTSICIGDHVRDDLVGRRLYFAKEYHDGLVDISDGEGNILGFVPIDPLLMLMIDSGRDAVLKCIYYSHDDGVPSVIAVMLAPED